ncbi:hypothetical protein DNH61_18145 [Paenibacillus sambharensis]|uniref:Alpha-L-glutamate ligase-related protein ATP-grasp domain-containing protein n=1 Tax=Paenibacillus sambharensis TaxID=1803190 RepID=A0A2W1LR85_9BACL|nr:sugar-transfer associated ATP-grasp domain-containing protein [Paenibacillus sambharensis]PZD94331.1 hypothetical protein DNH61_18145 [Paenibacillus sambharensis]
MIAQTVMRTVRRSGKTIQTAMKRAKYKNKIASIARSNGNVGTIQQEYSQRIDLYWEQHYGSKIKKAWHQAYASVNGVFDERYIPEDVYYIEIEPKLNRRELFKAYVDKSGYERILKGYLSPETILKNRNGYYADGSDAPLSLEDAEKRLLARNGMFFIKPSIESGGGKGVEALYIEQGRIRFRDQPASFSQVAAYYGRDFIVQDKLEQHAVLNGIYPNAINTLRILTLRLNGRIHLLSTLARFGNQGSVVDNQAAGGVSCSVHPDGRLNTYAIDKYGRKHQAHPYTGAVFGEKVIPKYEQAVQHVFDLHAQLPYFDLVSWDIAVDPEARPVLVELNLIGQEINFHQFNNGPLFGDLTDDILLLLKEGKGAK